MVKIYTVSSQFSRLATPSALSWFLHPNGLNYQKTLRALTHTHISLKFKFPNCVFATNQNYARLISFFPRLYIRFWENGKGCPRLVQPGTRLLRLFSSV
jgi:hypothetical protein